MHPLEVSNAALKANLSVAKMHHGMNNAVLADDMLQLDTAVALVAKEEKRAIENLDIIKQKILGDEGKSLAEETWKLFEQWQQIRKDVIDLARNGDRITAGRISNGKGEAHLLILEKKINSIAAYARKKADHFINQAVWIKKQIFIFTCIINILGITVSIVIAIFFSRQISDSLEIRQNAETAIREHSQRLEEMVEQRTNDLKETQIKLIRKEKLAAVGQIAGFVAHDIRNPLGAIGNAAYILERVLAGKENDKINKHLAIIRKEIIQANEIITDLLELSKDKPLKLEQGNLPNLINEVVKNIEWPENITVEKEIDQYIPLFLFDHSQIKRILYNIIMNSLQAMSEGGRLKIICQQFDGSVKVIFSDTGVGIKQENMSSVFEPLFSTKPKGTGLGLTIVKNFVENHHGVVDLQSTLYQGTIITITFPIVQGVS